MKHSLKHIILFGSVAFTLTIAVLSPTALKFAHSFEHHDHDICKTPQTLHFHELKFDCDLCDFQLTQTYLLSQFDYQLSEQTTLNKTVSEQYEFKYCHQQLSFSLRGPPLC
ncbi:MAG: hypothetical protein HRT67_07500 [Flavobacteriaceae bacterium]|nr:hypothetical protein [Flavobacteriaceae bacterium]